MGFVKKTELVSTRGMENRHLGQKVRKKKRLTVTSEQQFENLVNIQGWTD